MTQLLHVASRLFNVPLLVTPEYGAVITSVLSDRVGVQPIVGGDITTQYRRPASEITMHGRTGIAVMPIVGGMVHRGGELEAASGIQSYTAIHNKLTALANDNSVRGILLDIDSGGGEVAGLQELVAYIQELSREKPVWGLANTTAGSAAYWTISGTERVFAAPNARVGSIGVYVQHVDMSKQIEKRGLVVSLIYAGQHKVEGNPFEPLPDNVRAGIQAGVDNLYGEFVAAVAENRGLDAKKIRRTEAAVFDPAQAYELGLVDGVGGLGSVLKAFTEELNRPFMGYVPGDKMAKELIYDQDALDRAKSEGVKTGKAEAGAEIASLQSQLSAAQAEKAELLKALGEVAGDHPKVAIFAEALNEGGSVALASKMAAKVQVAEVKPQAAPEPKSATQAQVDAFMAQNAPNVSDAGAAPPADAKAARLAELQGSMAGFNKAKGYGKSA